MSTTIPPTKANTSGSSPSNMNSLDLKALRSVDLSKYLSNDASGMVPIEVPKLQDDFKNVGPRVTSSAAVAGGLGSYGTYNGVGINQDAFNAINGTDHGGTLTQNPSTPSTLGSTLQGVGSVAEGIGALGSAYIGLQNLALAEDQFDFEKKATNRNLLNQGTQINNAYTNASNVGLALGGGAMTADQIAAEKQALQNRYVNTSAIG